MNAKAIQRLDQWSESSIKKPNRKSVIKGNKDRRTRTYWREKAEKARRKKTRYDTFRIEEQVDEEPIAEKPEEAAEPPPPPPPLKEEEEEEEEEEEDLFEEHRIYHFDLDFDPETQTLSSGGGWYYKRARDYDAEQSDCKRSRLI